MKSNFHLIVVCLAAAIFPPVISTQLPDIQGCVTSIVFNTFKEGTHLGAMIDISECIVNGTIGNCQLQCMVDVNACMPARDPQCLNIEFRKCINTCIDNPNFLTTSCFNSALDIVSFVPIVGIVASLYQIFTGCIDTATFGLNWVKGVITKAQAAIAHGAVAHIEHKLCQSVKKFKPLHHIC